MSAHETKAETTILEFSDPSQALGRIPSGLFVVTFLKKDGTPEGMLASWVQQCSMEPLMVSVALRADRAILEALAPGAHFHVHVIKAGQNQLVARFAKSSKGEHRFADLELHQEENMPPVLKDACSVFRCVAGTSTETGDHRLLVARVISGAMLLGGEPMVHIRKTGKNY